jgi:hypothetical protein
VPVAPGERDAEMKKFYVRAGSRTTGKVCRRNFESRRVR